jgi:hypothetical protein
LEVVISKHHKVIFGHPPFYFHPKVTEIEFRRCDFLNAHFRKNFIR